MHLCMWRQERRRRVRSWGVQHVGSRNSQGRPSKLHLLRTAMNLRCVVHCPRTTVTATRMRSVGTSATPGRNAVYMCYRWSYRVDVPHAPACIGRPKIASDLRAPRPGRRAFSDFGRHEGRGLEWRPGRDQRRSQTLRSRRRARRARRSCVRRRRQRREVVSVLSLRNTRALRPRRLPTRSA